MAGDREAAPCPCPAGDHSVRRASANLSLGGGEDAGRGIETLNAFLAGALPRIAQHGGVVDRFDGEELLAFFGILPRALPPAVSALQATHAGLELLDLIRDLNDGGGAGLRPLHISIGVDTGRVVAGGLGTRSDCSTHSSATRSAWQNRSGRWPVGRARITCSSARPPTAR